MGGLMSAVLSSAGALSVLNQEFTTISNNISNANTPGYADQSLALVAQSGQDSTGGVMSAGLISSRSEYLEQNVRNQQTLLGSSQQMASDLGQVQPLFNPTSTSGIPSSLSSFFNSFSQLSITPNDAPTRQGVIAAADQAAQSFNEVAAGITQVANGVASQTTSTVAQVNQLASQIATINKQYLSDSSAEKDPGLDAQVHTDLQSLSQLANVSMVKSNDGTYDVYLGGQTPLVIGSQQFKISSGFSSAQTQILDSQGKDVASQITGGSLGAMIQENNTTLPGYMTQLNTLAQTFADQVNGQLSQGLDSNGGTPTTNLFTYNQAAGAASTLAVTNITASQIAAASVGAPGGDGNALAVAGLAHAAVMNGSTLTQGFATLSAQVGSDVATAQQNQTNGQDLLAQAQQQEQQVSGVNLNAEAAKLIQFQQSYQALGQMVSTLNSLTQTLLNIIPSGSSA